MPRARIYATKAVWAKEQWDHNPEFKRRKKSATEISRCKRMIRKYEEKIRTWEAKIKSETKDPQMRNEKPARVTKGKMGIYECTLYERPEFGERQPVKYDGKTVSQEIVAENGNRARNLYRMRLSDVFAVKMTDIRVKSLNKRKAEPLPEGHEWRIHTANMIIQIIAKYGRHFLSENSDARTLVGNPFVSYFFCDPMNELWYVDRCTRKPVLVRHQEWRGFTEGGTLRGCIQHLGLHITSGSAINPRYFCVSESWIPDHWGYGADKEKVAEEVQALLKERSVQ